MVVVGAHRYLKCWICSNSGAIAVGTVGYPEWQEKAVGWVLVVVVSGMGNHMEG